MMESTTALARRPLFYAAAINNPRTNPLWRGASCGDLRCGNMGDFLDLVIGPTGHPWASLVDGCPGKANHCVPDCGGLDNSCPSRPSTNTTRGEGAVGTVVGGPSLAPIRLQGVRSPSIHATAASAPASRARSRAPPS
jgi:hypothetical protein